MSRFTAGRELAAQRARLGLDQGEIAKKARLSLQQVGRLERGESLRPDPAVVARLLATLQLPVGAWWEMFGTPEPDPITTALEHQMPTQERAPSNIEPVGSEDGDE